ENLPWTSTPNRDTLELVPIGHLLPVELPPDIVMSGREMAFHGITGGARQYHLPAPVGTLPCAPTDACCTRSYAVAMASTNGHESSRMSLSIRVHSCQFVDHL